MVDLREQVRAGRWREAVVAAEGDAAWRPIEVVLAEDDLVGNASTVVHAAAVRPAYGSAPSILHPTPAPDTIAGSTRSRTSYPPGVGPGRASIPSSLAPSTRLSNAGLLVLSFVGALVLAILAFSVVVFARRGGDKGLADSIVRVVVQGEHGPSGSGTGFFVAGPDDGAYVATAYHVIASGEPLLVEQTLSAPKQRKAEGRQYEEAFPDVEVVAYDAEADLAILRLNGVTRDHFRPLPLATAAVADEAVLSYGFPGSNLAHQFGMVSKPGKVLSLVRFPVTDLVTGEVVRADATPGLLVSVDVEPGFSGGPTLNDRGEVVGVNVTKDLGHRGQNGAVSVEALRNVVKQVAKLSDAKDPAPEEVKHLLERIEREYLLLPVERRKSAREDDLISASDLPRVRDLVTELRRLEDDTTRRSDSKLSGAASLGIVLARLPGRPLETYRDRSTRKALADCEVRQRGLREFFGSLANSPSGRGSSPPAAPDEAREKCSELAFRPVVWDLTAMALEWGGQPRDIAVSKVDVVDPDRHIYKAAIRFAGESHLVDVWLGGDGGRLRLKLFDRAGEASGLSTARDVSASSFAGTWHRSDARVAHNVSREIESDTDTEETLAVTMTGDGAAHLTHQLHRRVYMTGPRRLACGGSTLHLGIEQSFTGSLESGSVTAVRSLDPKPLGADMARCGEVLGYAPDLVFVLKPVGDKLLVYRTGGAEYPEVVEFTREL